MTAYVPERDRPWERIAPNAVGFSPERLAEALTFAQAHECEWPRSMHLDDGRFIGIAYVGDKPPYDEVIGPVRARGGTNGVLLRHGRIVAEWGDTQRVDMTFSAAKSYLAVLAGLAVDDGLIPSVDDPVHRLIDDGHFGPPHNDRITWRHMLQQTSEWQGTLWGKPDSVDHNRQAGVEHDNRQKGTVRALELPGTRWEYNDVRVNRLALALLQVFRRPLPEVLRERIMDPIGASDRWEWRGYRNSVVDIDGRPIESVSGGGHWGGGIFISSWDHARLGLLIGRGGRWGERQLLSPSWIAALRTPCAVNPSYGYLWWLNTDRRLFPAAPESSIFALGGGQHVIWLDDVHDIVMVARWVARDQCDGLIARVLASLA